MNKTKFSSYSLNGIPEGCKYCVRGEKLVVFISGKCSRNCWYCSLSNKRKNKDAVWINERKINNKDIKSLIKEARESNAKGAGITGGDALLFLDRTIRFAKKLKQKNKNFHIHIYLPTKLVTVDKLKKLSKYVDEVRFHPEFLIHKEKAKEDIEKIKLAKEFWRKKDIGVELPLIPDKKREILDFILKIKDFIGFVNLNEFEISDTNFNRITRDYKLNKDSYTIANSIKAGLWILDKLKKEKKLKVHLCTAETKNNYQYKNRLKLHAILPFGRRTGDGTVLYLIGDLKYKNKLGKKEYYYDKRKQRLILSQKAARKIDYRIVEEFPTYDGYELD